MTLTTAIWPTLLHVLKWLYFIYHCIPSLCIFSCNYPIFQDGTSGSRDCCATGS